MKTIGIEIAKKLKKLGVNQSIAYMHWVKEIEVEQEKIYQLPFQQFCYKGSIKDSFAALTLDEILDMLSVIKKESVNYHPLIQKVFDNLYCAFYADCNINRHLYIEPQWGKNPAEATGQLLMWCIENEYVKPEELNATL